jgi:hypothetical protein
MFATGFETLSEYTVCLNRQTSDFSHLKDNDGTFGTNVVE